MAGSVYLVPRTPLLLPAPGRSPPHVLLPTLGFLFDYGEDLDLQQSFHAWAIHCDVSGFGEIEVTACRSQSCSWIPLQGESDDPLCSRTPPRSCNAIEYSIRQVLLLQTCLSLALPDIRSFAGDLELLMCGPSEQLGGVATRFTPQLRVASLRLHQPQINGARFSPSPPGYDSSS